MKAGHVSLTSGLGLNLDDSNTIDEFDLDAKEAAFTNTKQGCAP